MVIGECGLSVGIVSALLLILKTKLARALIVCTDNQDVFGWLKSRNAKSGRLSGLRRASIDYLVNTGLRLSPDLAASGAIPPRDCLSRTDECGIRASASTMHMGDKKLSTIRKNFCDSWKRALGSGAQCAFRFRDLLRTFGYIAAGGGWGPSRYAFAAVVRKSGDIFRTRTRPRRCADPHGDFPCADWSTFGPTAWNGVARYQIG